MSSEQIIKNATGIDGKTTQATNTQASFVEPNVLNQFASYTYVFTLSGLSRGQIQNSVKVLQDPIHDPIARTGGIGRGTYTDFNSTKYEFSNFEGQDKSIRSVLKKQIEDVIPDARNADQILRRGHDIFFEKVNITAVPRPNNERKLMNYTKIEMELSEPFGVTLFEKLRACAFNNGFIDHIDAPFLLSLEFKGFDSNGVEKKVITKRFMPIKITNCEMSINAGGTTYYVTAVPWTEFGMTDRFLYPRDSGQVSGNTFVEAMQNFAKKLNEDQDGEITSKTRALKDRYVITVSPRFLRTLKDATTNIYDIETAFAVDPIRFAVNPRTSIADIITKVILNADPFNKVAELAKKYWIELDRTSTTNSMDFALASDLPDPMIPWFKIKTNVQVLEQMDDVRKQHQKIIHFMIEPYDLHVMNFAVPGLGGKKLWGKTVKKNYDFIFTGANTEVLDLKLDYKYGYFQSRLLDFSRTEGNTNKLKDTSEQSKLESIIKRYGGNALYPEPLMPLRHEPNLSKSEDTTTFDRAPRSQTDEFYDYLTNPRGDMMKVEMQIMGDPAFVGQDMFLPSDSNFNLTSDTPKNVAIEKDQTGRFQGRFYDERLGCFNYDEAEPLVTLNFRFPTDIDPNKGTMNFQNLENVQFSGLYKVTQVESVFDKGTFTQNLLMVRFNNQSGDFTSAPILYEEERGKSESQQNNQSGLGGSQETDFEVN